MNEADPYTNESILHLWWLNGHSDILQELLAKEKRMVYLSDAHSNTPFHALWLNTTSSDTELIPMFQYLHQHQVNLSKQNNHGQTGIDIMTQRIKDKNPYDGNLDSLSLLYCNVLDSVPKQMLEELKSKKGFIPKNKILNLTYQENFTAGSRQGSISDINKLAGKQKRRLVSIVRSSTKVVTLN